MGNLEIKLLKNESDSEIEETKKLFKNIGIKNKLKKKKTFCQHHINEFRIRLRTNQLEPSSFLLIKAKFTFNAKLVFTQTVSCNY